MPDRIEYTVEMLDGDYAKNGFDITVKSVFFLAKIKIGKTYQKQCK